MGRTRLREQQVEDSDLVSEHELKASLLDSPLVQGIFPVSVASTSAGTGQITLEDPIVQTSMTASGDHLQVVGGTAAGVYEVTSIVDDYTVIVSPASLTSTSNSVPTGLAIWLPILTFNPCAPRGELCKRKPPRVTWTWTMPGSGLVKVSVLLGFTSNFEQSGSWTTVSPLGPVMS